MNSIQSGCSWTRSKQINRSAATGKLQLKELAEDSNDYGILCRTDVSKIYKVVTLRYIVLLVSGQEDIVLALFCVHFV